MPMRAGPKGQITAPPLDLRRLPRRGGARAVRFIERYVTVPKGTGARHRLRIRPWQREIIYEVLDDPRPRQALVSIPAGNGKSTLAAALGLYGLLADRVEGAQVLVIASDERQARIILNTARRMVELEPALYDRVQIFKDHLLEPHTDSRFMALPSGPGALQGWDPSLAIVDELHVVTDDTFEAMAARAGKREQSLLLAISTPPKAGQDDSVMRRLVDHGREAGDPSFYFREFMAPQGAPSMMRPRGRLPTRPSTTSSTVTPSGPPSPPRCARPRSAVTGWASGSRSRMPGCPMAPGPHVPSRWRLRTGPRW
jgi:hypothetical protein